MTFFWNDDIAPEKAPDWVETVVALGVVNGSTRGVLVKGSVGGEGESGEKSFMRFLRFLLQRVWFCVWCGGPRGKVGLRLVLLYFLDWKDADLLDLCKAKDFSLFPSFLSLSFSSIQFSCVSFSLSVTGCWLSLLKTQGFWSCFPLQSPAAALFWVMIFSYLDVDHQIGWPRGLLFVEGMELEPAAFLFCWPFLDGVVTFTRPAGLLLT